MLVAGAVVGIAYAASRALRSRDVPRSVDELQEQAAATVPDEVQDRAVGAVPGEQPAATIRNRTEQTIPDGITEITIEGPRSEESETDPGVGSPTEPGRGGSGETNPTGLTESGDVTDERGPDEDGDVLDETEANADYADDRSDEEITERTESDESAEPGEMAVDEDVVDDLVADDAAAESDEETEE